MNSTCRHCGKETEEGQIYCALCLDSPETVRPKKFWVFAIFFSLVLLVLSGMLLWHGSFDIRAFSLDDITGKPAATINGEAVSREYLRTRLLTAKHMIERQYGEDTFAGKMGKNRLASLKREVLDRILGERLIAQEARRLGLVITDEMVEQELRRIGTEIYGSGEDLQKMLGNDGIDKDALKNHIRNTLTFQALAKVKLAQAGQGVEPEAYVDAWLGQVKKLATVVVYDSSVRLANTFPGADGCCGDGAGGGCGGRQTGRAPDPQLEGEARAAALAEYRKKNPAEKEVAARVTDYGCHVQVDIEKGGRVLWSYAYQDGKISDN